MTHICVSKLTIIGSDNGLSPGRRQAIIWTNAGILSIGPYGTNFGEILIDILTSSFTKMSLKVSSAKWRPFCLGLNELILTIWRCYQTGHNHDEADSPKTEKYWLQRGKIAFMKHVHNVKTVIRGEIIGKHLISFTCKRIKLQEKSTDYSPWWLNDRPPTSFPLREKPKKNWGVPHRGPACRRFITDC